jgi:hypothetical protein
VRVGCTAVSGVAEGIAVDVGTKGVAVGVEAGSSVEAVSGVAVRGSASFAGELAASGLAVPPHAASSRSSPAPRKQYLMFKELMVVASRRGQRGEANRSASPRCLA